MSISLKKLVSVFLVLSLGLFTSCNKDDEALLEAITQPGDQPPGNTDPVKPDPNEPTPVVGKKRVIIGNFADALAAKPKKDSKGYSQTGVWTQSSLKGFKDSISRYSREASASANYETTKLGTAKYCVSVYKVQHANSEVDTSVKLFDDGVELYSTSLDFTKGGGWTHLGEFEFKGAKVSRVSLSRGDNSNGGVLRADEVRFLKMKEGHDCFGKKFAKIKNNGVLDNKFDPTAEKPKKDSAGYREMGTFYKSALKGFKDTISRYSREDGAYITYSAEIQNPTYCMKVYRVTHPNSAKEVKVTISQGSTILEESILDYSLAESEAGWVELGNVDFDTSTPVVVKIEKVSQGSGVLRADAVKFQKKACK